MDIFPAFLGFFILAQHPQNLCRNCSRNYTCVYIYTRLHLLRSSKCGLIGSLQEAPWFEISPTLLPAPFIAKGRFCSPCSLDLLLAPSVAFCLPSPLDFTCFGVGLALLLHLALHHLLQALWLTFVGCLPTLDELAPCHF